MIPYAQLRERLRQRLAVPSHVKFDAIYARDPLGDRSPSAYLRDTRKKFRDAEIDNEEQRTALCVHTRSSYQL